MMWLAKLAIGLALAYAAVVALIYAAQTWLIFPAGLAGQGAPTLPSHAERLEVETPEGERLAGVRIGAAETAGATHPVILGFGGNAWNGDALALYLHESFPAHDVVAFHYRGYAPSTGRPSAKAILDDALLVYDHVASELARSGVIAIGLSLGGGPAARVADERDPAGVILVTPFDSLEALARHHYPWAPVRPFLRHRMQIAEMLSRASAPAAIITAERDTIVPAARAAPVARAARRLVLEQTIQGVGHNDLYGSAAFHQAMREALRLIEADGRSQ